jgi:hypothetical protein
MRGDTLTNHDENKKCKNKNDMTGSEIKWYSRFLYSTAFLIPTKLTVPSKTVG